MSIIRVDNLRKTYHTDGVETPVLHGISFNIEKGEFVAIMGPSGSGKSTLLHILGFLSQPTTGFFWFDGRAIDEYSEIEVARVRNQKMGFVFQSFNLLARTSVLDNIKLPLLYSDRNEKEWDGLARQAVNDVGLNHRINYDTSKLSGGERQRVAIARAFVNEPQVIFADEPTGNLDSKSGHSIMGILKHLNEAQGQTIILITHEEEIAVYAHRLIKLRDGRLESDEEI